MTDGPHSPRTPVLIGGGQKTWRKGPCPGPRAMLREVVALAAADAGVPLEALAATDTIGVVGFTIDSPGRTRAMPVPRMANPPFRRMVHPARLVRLGPFARAPRSPVRRDRRHRHR